jgi:hypothetical protein
VTAVNISLPWGLIGRVWSVMRQNPCTIEIIDRSSDGQQWIRVRNDSAYPTKLSSVSFTWGLGWTRRSYSIPMPWLTSNHTDRVLAPADSFEHPVNAHEIGEVAAWCEITVHHNRSAHPAKKRFSPRISKAQLRRLKSRNAALSDA